MNRRKALHDAVVVGSLSVRYGTREAVYRDLGTMRRHLASLFRPRTYRIDVPVSTAETYRHPQRIVDRAVRRAKLPRGTRVKVVLRAAVELTRGSARGSCAYVPYFWETVYAS